jgi:hypothetical protein
VRDPSQHLGQRQRVAALQGGACDVVVLVVVAALAIVVGCGQRRESDQRADEQIRRQAEGDGPRHAAGETGASLGMEHGNGPVYGDLGSARCAAGKGVLVAGVSRDYALPELTIR